MLLPIYSWIIWIIIGVDPAVMGYPSLGATLERLQGAQAREVVSMPARGSRGR